MKTLINLALAGAFALFTLATNAQNNKERQKPTPEQAAEKQTNKFQEKLGLDATQKDKVYQALLERAKQSETDKTQCKGDGKCLHAATKARNLKLDQQLKTILTAEQYQKLQEVRKENKQKRELKAESKKGGKPATPAKEIAPEKAGSDLD